MIEIRLSIFKERRAFKSRLVGAVECDHTLAVKALKEHCVAAVHIVFAALLLPRTAQGVAFCLKHKVSAKSVT